MSDVRENQAFTSQLVREVVTLRSERAEAVGQMRILIEAYTANESDPGIGTRIRLGNALDASRAFLARLDAKGGN